MKTQISIFLFLASVLAGETIRGARTPTEEPSKQAIPTVLIDAIIDQESAGNPHASRFEPLLYQRYRASLPKNEVDARMMVSSIGLMQVIPFFHMRECGLKHWSELYREDVNRECGMRVLESCFKKTRGQRDSLVKAVSCYNGASSAYAPAVLSRVGRTILSQQLSNNQN